ncbi:MAG: CCA tRNA nucleotidyltransferase [Candidatus Omnitrophica bacterium]|nr:CCA tRNA nucleotidyltransferase [Candidatus Omnitrophota bacterium]
MDIKKKLALDILGRLRAKGFQAYFAGGCVRDMVMKAAPRDYDIATDARPGQIKELFKRTVSVGAAFGTVLVISDGLSFEVSTFRGHEKNEFSGDPRTDALNRDFTINGLLYDPIKRRVADYCGGRADIKKKLIRAIGDPWRCFQRDKLRLLRAPRLSAALGFGIEARTFAAIKGHKDEIAGVSKERVRDELTGILTGKNPYKGMKLLDETGLLSVILPEIEALKGVEQPPEFHPEGDVFTHTMLLMKQLKGADLVLAFAALLHDVGKPATFKKADRIRFNGHDRIGAKIAEAALRRLRFSNDQIRKITYCVDNHMRVISAMKMREATLKRMFLKDTFETELSLHKLDCAASHSDLKIYRFLKKKFQEFKRTPVHPRPILNGHEIMAMGFSQGPLIGKIQRRLVDMQLSGKIKSPDEARRYVYEKFLKR